MLVNYEELGAELKAISAIMSAEWYRGLEDETGNSAVSKGLARFVGATMRKCCGKRASSASVRHQVYARLVQSPHPLSAYGLGSYAARAFLRWVYGDTAYAPKELPTCVLIWLADSANEDLEEEQE